MTLMTVTLMTVTLMTVTLMTENKINRPTYIYNKVER